MRKTVALLAMLILYSVFAVGQTKTVTGQVTDDKGDPIPFATVKQKGSSTGVAADQDGRFSITIDGKATITISAAGFQSQDVVIDGQNNISIALVTTSALQEVIVTAMGISREKKSLGYATQGVKADALIQGGNTGLAGALQGKVSGVQITPSSGMPGASSLITVRGARSFTGNNTPLYVIDGMPIASEADILTGNSVTGTDIANRAVDIDPNDIANIEILKGQAASALYGIRASNGVVVITTKVEKGHQKENPR